MMCNKPNMELTKCRCQALIVSSIKKRGKMNDDKEIISIFADVLCQKSVGQWDTGVFQRTHDIKKGAT